MKTTTIDTISHFQISKDGVHYWITLHGDKYPKLSSMWVRGDVPETPQMLSDLVKLAASIVGEPRKIEIDDDGHIQIAISEESKETLRKDIKSEKLMKSKKLYHPPTRGTMYNVFAVEGGGHLIEVWEDGYISHVAVDCEQDVEDKLELLQDSNPGSVCWHEGAFKVIGLREVQGDQEISA